MLRTIAVAALIVAAALSCESNHRTPDDEDRIEAADAFTNRYAQSRLARWKLKGHASGARCDVLLVETAIIMEDSMVAAVHYGAGNYGVHEGGVQRFARERAFRGVVYRDSSQRVWRFGEISPAETATIVPCR